MTYDDYKLDNPFHEEDEKACAHCGAPSEAYYCSKGCKIADNE